LPGSYQYSAMRPSFIRQVRASSATACPQTARITLATEGQTTGRSGGTMTESGEIYRTSLLARITTLLAVSGLLAMQGGPARADPDVVLPSVARVPSSVGVSSRA
jgi:hypothetical protein